jgi:5'-deoxynucleotidase YfbR-like HD superfamily hydrolase
MADPRECDWAEMQHILRYLRATHDYGLFYRKTDKVATASTEAEYYSVSEAAKESIWTRSSKSIERIKHTHEESYEF